MRSGCWSAEELSPPCIGTVNMGGKENENIEQQVVGWGSSGTYLTSLAGVLA